ncbi:MAG: serine--tRNA ligase [Chloroflexi bacterium]|nr:serine--tRNA ligase [Chloroflexota bacterium]
MLDINLIREQPDLVRAGMQKRQIDPAPVDQALSLDSERRKILVEVETLKSERNKVSKEIGKMKDEKERLAKIEASRNLGDEIKVFDDQLRVIEAELHDVMAVIPNVPYEQVPPGGEADNITIREVGELPKFDFEPKAHWDLGPELDIIDFEQGVRVSGTRFFVLTGAGARLQRALISWMLDLHIRQGYTEKYVPYLVRERTVFGAGQLPKFKDNLYKDHEEDLYLIPTSEVTLTGIHMGEILAEESLPRYYTAYSPCFRREKMSAGRDVRGIKRVHQFDKVEMYKYCKPEDSDAELEKMVADAEQTCQDLGLPYRVLLKAAGDTSEAAHISYDIEAWSAGCAEWLEVSSISNVGSYQAQRANIRYKPADGGSPQPVHTLNGSGLGMSRALIAVLENNQQADGSIVIPEVLHPWMGGLEVIQKESK